VRERERERETEPLIYFVFFHPFPVYTKHKALDEPVQDKTAAKGFE
jgi:hypothetical protein